MVRVEGDFTSSRLPSGISKFHCRHGVETQPRCERLATGKDGLQGHIGEMADQHRPLCNILERTDTEICQLVPTARGIPERCVVIQLGGVERLRVPPFFLIKNCLSKIRREKSEIILVCPYWPSQPWFPVLLELASSTPAIFRPSENLLLSSLGDPHPLCMKPTFLLTAWKLSGDVSKGKIFRNQLLSYYWQPTGRPHTLLTSPPGALGVIGVWDKVSIPCQLI